MCFVGKDCSLASQTEGGDYLLITNLVAGNEVGVEDDDDGDAGIENRRAFACRLN